MKTLVLCERPDVAHEVNALRLENVQAAATYAGGRGYLADQIIVLMRGEPRALSDSWRTEEAVYEAMRPGVDVVYRYAGVSHTSDQLLELLAAAFRDLTARQTARIELSGCGGRI